MFKLIKMTTALAVLSVLAFAIPVSAAGEGQIEGGDIYRIKNLTKNVEFTDPANADSCNVLQYKVRIHNPGPGFLSKVGVKATLPTAVANSHTSTIAASSINADPEITSDTTVVNLSSTQSLSYVNGSTQLLDANGSVVSTLPDGITQGGVSIGDVGVSVDNRKYVQFQVKVSCSPVTPTPTPTPGPGKPGGTLPNTGPGDIAGLFVGTSVLGGAGHYLVTRRRK